MQKTIYMCFSILLLSPFFSLNGMSPQQPAQILKPQEKQPEDLQKSESQLKYDNLTIKEMEAKLIQMEEEVAKMELQNKIGEKNIKSLESFVECDTLEDFLLSVKETAAQLKVILPKRPETPK